jgi:hypothetical protein
MASLPRYRDGVISKCEGGVMGAAVLAGTHDTSSSLHPTSSDSMEKVAMRERIVIGEEATGGAEEDEDMPGACDPEDDEESGGAAIDTVR